MVNNASDTASKETPTTCKTKKQLMSAPPHAIFDPSICGPQRIVCDVCQVPCGCLRNFDEHCKGKKHIKNVKKAQQPSSKSTHVSENDDSLSVVFDSTQDSNATEVNMSASKKKTRKYKHNLYQDNGYYPNQQYQPYPNQHQPYPNQHQPYPNQHQPYPNQHQPYPDEHYTWYPNQHRPYPHRYHQPYNFRHNQRKNRNLQSPQGSFWQKPPGDFRNGDYNQRDVGLHNECQSSTDESPVNQVLVQADVHAPNDGTSSESTISMNVQLLESHNPVDSNPKCPISPGKNSNSVAKNLLNKKQNSPVVLSGQESNKCSKSSDDEKQLERRSILAENVTEKIAHWINPSNPKAKAEINRMVTEFSKSKKKENLLKLKLQADSSSNENNCDIREETSVPNTHSPSVKQNNLWTNKKKRSKSETVQQVSNINPFISDETSGGKFPRGKRLRRFKSSTESVPRKVRRRSLSNSVSVESFLSENAQVLREVAAEKKQKEQKSGASKKHTCSTAECLESCIKETEITSSSLVNKETTSSVYPIPSTSSMDVCTSNTASTLNPVSYQPATSNPVSKGDIPKSAEQVPKVSVKKETTDEGLNMQLHPCILEAFTLEDHLHIQTNGNVNQSDEATVSPVESLINLFTSGNIKIKKEFDDPLIDVIRTVDPEILNRVCEGQSPVPTVQEPPVVNNATEGSIVSSEKPSVNKTSVMDSADSEDAINYLPFFKSSIKNILNEIQSISSLEDELKNNQEQADSKIQEYQALVDEWKTKKIKFQSEEETLRKQRNNLVRTMADLVTQCNVEHSIVADIVSQNNPTPSNLMPTADDNVTSLSGNSSTEQKHNSLHGAQSSKRRRETSETEEIAILPPPVKSTNIPVIDLEECQSSEVTSPTENGLSSDTDVLLEKFCKKRNYIAHQATINCIQVFEDYIYTAANDSTAKRFSLKGGMEIVTYFHPKRNVIQLCVEKVRGWTLVFTICNSSKVISSFKAEDGVLFRTFSLSFIVSCICKGRGLIYAGLRSGTIVVCNWKDHKEIVNTSEPIRSIDTTSQGCINMLVTLSTVGNISFRDADRNGLLIRYIKARSYIPLFMTVCSDSIYLSSAGVLTVLNIESGKFVTKYSFSTAYTCLTVYKDSIFTASYSGIVRCYSKNEEKPVKMYYGAGRNSITCMHVHNGWVFTANRAGLISAFKYDPNTSHSCKIGKCDFIFPQLEDLEWHVLKDHDLPKAKAQCTWRKCQFIIPHNWDCEAIEAHIRNHL